MRPDLRVPFFRPDLGSAEIAEVVDVLRSGWLTTGPRVRQFETAFAASVGARYAVAVNSATAALHLAVESLGASGGQGVLVPTMTFAATADARKTRSGLRIYPDEVTANWPMERLLSPVGERKPAEALDETLRAMTARYGSRTTDFVAMQLEYPRNRTTQ